MLTVKKWWFVSKCLLLQDNRVSVTNTVAKSVRLHMGYLLNRRRTDKNASFKSIASLTDPMLKHDVNLVFICYLGSF